MKPEVADRELASHGADWWRAWDQQALDRACGLVPVESLERWPRVAYWRALASFMSEGSDALACLDAAFRGHEAAGDRTACRRDAGVALTMSLLDVGAMDRVDEWVNRAGGQQDEAMLQEDAFWRNVGTLSRAVLGADQSPVAADSAAWLHEQLTPLRNLLSADERLIAAQVLVNHHLASQNYEQFDLLATLAESGGQFLAASPVMRARWWYTLGFAHYQIGNHERAESSWNSALELARNQRLTITTLVTSLAVVRLLLDRGRVAEARAIERRIDPRWGGGRASQLVLLQQMRARLLLLENQAIRAHATLLEALALAAQAGLSAPEQASCLTDFVQSLIALNRHGDAEIKLGELVHDHRGRDASVYRCLLSLLDAWQRRDIDPRASRQKLLEGLVLAQHLRYTMFFRLLPAFAADLCGLALRDDVEVPFVVEVIRDRALAAPASADSRWPWPLWIGMLGGFQIRIDAEPLISRGKEQAKPLELLRLLACQGSMSMSLMDAAERLWPEADESARKNIEMTVQRLRRLLSDDTLVVVKENRIVLDATRVNSDVRCRRQLIDRLVLMATRVAGLPPGAVLAGSEHCASTIAAVTELGLGPLLPGIGPARWLDDERDRCEREVADAALAAAQVMRHVGAGVAEQELLELALRRHPLDERLTRRLVEAYAGAGRETDAIRICQRFRDALAKERMQVDPRLEAAFRQWLGRSTNSERR